MIEEVTYEFLENLKTEEGGYTREALVLLGIPWPAPHGWKHEIIGKLVSVDPEDFERTLHEKTVGGAMQGN